MSVRVCYLKPEDDDVINTLMSSINIELYETYFDLINTLRSINMKVYRTYFDLFPCIVIFNWSSIVFSEFY